MSLNQSNPPVPFDVLAVDAAWDNEGTFTIAPNATWTMPAGNSVLPPVYGCGAPSVRSSATAVVSSPNGPTRVRLTIGVANPSEIQIPMRPFRGDEHLDYVEVDIPIGGTETITLQGRLDKLDPTLISPNPYGSWTMNANPNNPPPVVREDWPSLSPSITNLSAFEITVVSFVFDAEVIR